MPAHSRSSDLGKPGIPFRRQQDSWTSCRLEARSARPRRREGGIGSRVGPQRDNDGIARQVRCGRSLDRQHWRLSGLASGAKLTTDGARRKSPASLMQPRRMGRSGPVKPLLEWDRCRECSPSRAAFSGLANAAPTDVETTALLQTHKAETTVGKTQTPGLYWCAERGMTGTTGTTRRSGTRRDPSALRATARMALSGDARGWRY